MKALLPLFQVPLIEPGKGLSMMLWSNTAIQTRKTNRDGQEMGLVQLLRTADHHNDTVVGTKKNSNKMLDSCFPSAFRMNCFSLLRSTISTIWGGKEGEMVFNYARGSWYSKHTETTIVILLVLFCLNEPKRESFSHTTSQTSCPFMLSGWKLVISAPLAAKERFMFWRMQDAECFYLYTAGLQWTFFFFFSG